MEATVGQPNLKAHDAAGGGLSPARVRYKCNMSRRRAARQSFARVGLALAVSVIVSACTASAFRTADDVAEVDGAGDAAWAAAAMRARGSRRQLLGNAGGRSSRPEDRPENTPTAPTHSRDGVADSLQQACTPPGSASGMYVFICGVRGYEYTRWDMSSIAFLVFLQYTTPCR